jgi:hypothetical protein
MFFRAKEKYIEVNKARKSDQNTLLHLACMAKERCKIVEKLLAYPNINLQIKNAEGLTPVEIAAQYSNKAVEELLKAKMGKRKRSDATTPPNKRRKSDPKTPEKQKGSNSKDDLASPDSSREFKTPPQSCSIGSSPVAERKSKTPEQRRGSDLSIPDIPWNLNTKDWKTNGDKGLKYQSLLIKEGGDISDPDLFKKFTFFCEQLGFTSSEADKVYAISNPTLSSSFTNYRKTLSAKHRSKDAFNKNDWKETFQWEQRERYLSVLNDFSDKFPEWYQDSKSILLIQGTSLDAAWKICQNGFGKASTRDNGFYGQGIYFTNKLDYAGTYAKKEKNKSENFRFQVYVMAMVTPGNAYPVTEPPFRDGNDYPESLHGRACRKGYQSHFTIVDPQGTQLVNNQTVPVSLPVITTEIDHLKTAFEVVVYEEAQALPLFVFYKEI